MKEKIILFTRVPKVGTTKTRLYKFLKQQEAVELQKKLLKKTYDICKSAGNVTVYHGGTEQDNSTMLKILEQDNVNFSYQSGELLGDKMHNAIKEELISNDKVVLVGSDIFNLKVDDINTAFSKLDHYDVVINPSVDGGYYLIALKKPLYEIFNLASYGDSTVLEQIKNKCREYDYKLFVGRKALDIDTIEDLIMAEKNYDKVNLLGAGEYNINFLCEVNNKKEVFRINTKSQMNLDNQIEYEFETLKLLEKSGVTPIPYKVEKTPKILPHPYLTMEYLRGRPLNYNSDMKIASYLLSKIHGSRVEDNNLIHAANPFRLMYDECYKMANDYISWNKADAKVVFYLKRFLEICYKKIPLDYEISDACIINTELNSGNFLIGNSQEDSYIIDWEKALIGECEQDLAHFLVPTTTFWKTDVILTKKQIESFLTDYSKYRKYDKEKFERYFIFNCLRGVTWCSMAFREYSESEKTLMADDVFNKIKSYLDYNFLENISSYFKEE